MKAESDKAWIGVSSKSVSGKAGTLVLAPGCATKVIAVLELLAALVGICPCVSEGEDRKTSQVAMGGTRMTSQTVPWWTLSSSTSSPWWPRKHCTSVAADCANLATLVAVRASLRQFAIIVRTSVVNAAPTLAHLSAASCVARCCRDFLPRSCLLDFDAANMATSSSCTAWLAPGASAALPGLLNSAAGPVSFCTVN